MRKRLRFGAQVCMVSGVTDIGMGLIFRGLLLVDGSIGVVAFLIGLAFLYRGTKLGPDPAPYQRPPMATPFSPQQRAEARLRAKKLLRTHLTPEQIQSYQTQGFFEIEALSGRLWRLYPHWSGNLQLMRGKGANANSGTAYERTVKEGTSICVYARHPTDHEDMPIEDNLLAQVLMLRAPGGEEELLARGFVQPDETSQIRHAQSVLGLLANDYPAVHWGHY